VYRGRVARIAPYGAFVDLFLSDDRADDQADGDDGRRRQQRPRYPPRGLAHISQLCADRRVERVEDVLRVDQPVFARLLEIEEAPTTAETANGRHPQQQQRRLRLSLIGVDQETGQVNEQIIQQRQQHRGGGGGGGGGGGFGGGGRPPQHQGVDRRASERKRRLDSVRINWRGQEEDEGDGEEGAPKGSRDDRSRPEYLRLLWSSSPPPPAAVAAAATKKSTSAGDKKKRSGRGGGRDEDSSSSSESESSSSESSSDDSSEDSRRRRHRRRGQSSRSRGKKRSRHYSTSSSSSSSSDSSSSDDSSSESGSRDRKKRKRDEEVDEVGRTIDDDGSGAQVVGDDRQHEKPGIPATGPVKAADDDSSEDDEGPQQLSGGGPGQHGSEAEAAAAAAAAAAGGGANYGGALLPGEGQAIAQFVQQNLRIPRRGEIGYTGDDIDQFEKSGYVMSGSRHARMNAVRLRKENQVYSAEEQRALALITMEEKQQKEAALVEDFRKRLEEKQKAREATGTAKK